MIYHKLRGFDIKFMIALDVVCKYQSNIQTYSKAKFPVIITFLIENITYVVNTLVKAKPSTVKGKYIQNISISTTMGPGIHVDENSIDM